MQPDNLLLWTLAHDLEFGGVLLPFLGREDIVEHRCELAVIDFDVIFAEFGNCFRLGESDGANLGMGEDDRRDIFV